MFTHFIGIVQYYLQILHCILKPKGRKEIHSFLSTTCIPHVTTWRRHSNFVYSLLLTPKHFDTSETALDVTSENEIMYCQFKYRRI